MKLNRFAIITFIISVCTAIASVGVRIYLSEALLDSNGVYERSILPIVYHIVLAVSIIALAAVLIIIGRKKSTTSLIPGSTVTVFLACAVGFLLCADIFISVYGAMNSTEKVPVIDILGIAAAIPSAIFFFLLATQKEERSTPIAITSLFPPIWCAICVMQIYFDTTVLINSPNKILGEFSLILAMLFFLMESRNQIGISKGGFYLAAAVTAPILLLSSAVPNLICRDKFESDALSMIHCVTYIAIALFMYSRFLSSYRESNTPTDNQNI